MSQGGSNELFYAMASDHCFLQISYVAAGQGFAWNPEMFLPSYVEVDFEPLQNRREPVVDIIVTEEECRKWLSEDA